MSDRESEPKGKKSVRGWRAFFLMFGCGTLAAFLVFGLIFGALRMFVSGISSSNDDKPQAGDVPAEGTGEPHKSLPPDKLDLCSRTIDSLSSVNTNRVDSEEDYIDTIDDPSDSIRTVSDDCQWKLTPEYSVVDPWDFHLSYKAYIPQGKENAEKIARKKFDNKSKRIGESLDDTLNHGKKSMGDEAVYFYGKREKGVVRYIFLGRIKSVVYKMTFDDKNKSDDRVPKEAFNNEVDNMLDGMTPDINVWVPE